MVRETRLEPSNFILPLFVVSGEGVRREISSMPGNFQLSIDQAVQECADVHSLGISGVILFGIPEEKDEAASGAYADDGIVQQAVRAIKREAPRLLVVTDVEHVMRDFGGPDQAPILRETPAGLRSLDFASGSMGPKVDAVCRFVELTGGMAAIGSLDDAAEILAGRRGTIVTPSGQYDGPATAVSRHQLSVAAM